MKMLPPRLSRMTFFVNDRTAYLFLLAVSAAIKLTLCAVAPASYDLQALPATGFTASPWVVVENGLFETWKTVTDSNISYGLWATAAPPTMNSYLRLLSVTLRLPAFICDILMSVALYFTTFKITGSVQLGRLASLFWFLNPLTLFAVELLGVPDVLAALLTMLSILCLISRRPILSSILLAFSVGLKLYPILLLPAIFIYMHMQLEAKRRYELCLVASGALGIVAYLSWLLESHLSLIIEDFTTYTPVSTQFGVLSILSSSVPLSLAMAAVAAVYFLAHSYGERSNPTSNLVHTIIVVLLAYFTLSDFHPILHLDVAFHHT